MMMIIIIKVVYQNDYSVEKPKNKKNEDEKK